MVRLCVSLLAVAVVIAVAPSSAMAHAVLESTEPLSGSTSKQPCRPGRVPLQRTGRG